MRWSSCLPRALPPKGRRVPAKGPLAEYRPGRKRRSSPDRSKTSFPQTRSMSSRQFYKASAAVTKKASSVPHRTYNRLTSLGFQTVAEPNLIRQRMTARHEHRRRCLDAVYAVARWNKSARLRTTASGRRLPSHQHWHVCSRQLRLNRESSAEHPAYACSSITLARTPSSISRRMWST